MTRKFFTSDLHFFHKNILKYENRPYKDVEEMNKDLIENWNKKVNKDDEVYILGDISFGGIPETVELLKQLNGKKFLIEGNHDSKYLKSSDFKNQFIWIKKYKTIKINNIYMVLFHFPIYEWDRKHYDSIHLYGHIHSHIGLETFNNYSYNVGIDTNGYAPIEFNEILEKINYKKKKNLI